MEYWSDCINVKNILHDVVKEFHKKRNQYSMVEKTSLSYKEFSIVKEIITHIYKKSSNDETVLDNKRDKFVECSKLLLEWITIENHDDETKKIIRESNKKILVKHIMKAIFDKKKEDDHVAISKLPKIDETASCNLFKSKEELKKLSSLENLFQASY